MHSSCTGTLLSVARSASVAQHDTCPSLGQCTGLTRNTGLGARCSRHVQEYMSPHMVKEWVSEQCFTSPPTQYRLYGRDWVNKEMIKFWAQPPRKWFVQSGTTFGRRFSNGCHCSRATKFSTVTRQTWGKVYMDQSHPYSKEVGPSTRKISILVISML